MDDRENEKSLKASSVLLDGDPESDPEDFSPHEYHDEESIPDGKSVKSEAKPQFRLAFHLFKVSNFSKRSSNDLEKDFKFLLK